MVLGLIFLKYLSDKFEERYQTLKDEGVGPKSVISLRTTIPRPSGRGESFWPIRPSTFSTGARTNCKPMSVGNTGCLPGGT
ncbi:MAG: hypothetical protein LBO80_02520 [Treponema sp.]|nr:hypothetical protein [Treponema sp.]